jgi:predicted SAM-dependent methyltransferase
MFFHEKLELNRARSQALAAYLRSHQVRKLQLGAGKNVLDGWFNTDLAPSSPGVFYLDSTQRFPFGDATFRYILSEHHIEHLAYTQGIFTLRECHRVLEPGGRLRVATPSLEVLIELYTSAPDELQKRYIRFITDTFLPEIRVYSPAFVINNAFHNWGHQFLYDRATLQGVMEEVGFVDVAPAALGSSEDEQLRGVEMHGRFIGDEAMSRFETMVLEGRRP